MEKFTVKDFITYNNPCFSCGENIYFSIGITSSQLNMKVTSIRPTVSLDGTTLDLKVTYSKTLRVHISHKTNKISYSDFSSLSSYLSDHKLYLKSTCNKCYTSIESFFLDFNLEQGYVGPTGINQETLHVTDKLNHYMIYSDVFAGKSQIIISKSYGVSNDPIVLNTPLLLLHKFKTKKRLIEKLKTYMIFS